MMRYRVTFEEVPFFAEKSVKCSVCGKAMRRRKTFTATINPWNVNKDGTQRTRAEIRDVLREKAEAWKTEPEHHEKCKP